MSSITFIFSCLTLLFMLSCVLCMDEYYYHLPVQENLTEFETDKKLQKYVKVQEEKQKKYRSLKDYFDTLNPKKCMDEIYQLYRTKLLGMYADLHVLGKKIEARKREIVEEVKNKDPAFEID